MTAFLLLLWPLETLGREDGLGETEADLDGFAMTVFTYRPSGCARPSLLLAFHGDGRSAKRYRDHARPLADRLCLVVYAPLFDLMRFPRWRYHRGGIARKGRLRPPWEWTVDLAGRLLAWARQREGRPDAPAYLFGHSAGGQFLSRVAAFDPPDGAPRFVIANPSSYVAPSLDEAPPYGFKGISATSDQLRRYLSLPITIFLGSADTGSHNLLRHPAARRQGVHRFERGQNVFEAARSLARSKGWPFNWRLVIAHDVAHSARDMLRSDAVSEAFAWRSSP